MNHSAEAAYLAGNISPQDLKQHLPHHHQQQQQQQQQQQFGYGPAGYGFVAAPPTYSNVNTKMMDSPTHSLLDNPLDDFFTPFLNSDFPIDLSLPMQGAGMIENCKYLLFWSLSFFCVCALTIFRHLTLSLSVLSAIASQAPLMQVAQNQMARRNPKLMGKRKIELISKQRKTQQPQQQIQQQQQEPQQPQQLHYVDSPPESQQCNEDGDGGDNKRQKR